MLKFEIRISIVFIVGLDKNKMVNEVFPNYETKKFNPRHYWKFFWRISLYVTYDAIAKLYVT